MFAHKELINYKEIIKWTQMENLGKQAIKEIDAARQANALLLKEAFKVKTIQDMMNNCADRCELVYAESGISDDSVPGVTCFKNCLTKTYKLATTSLQ